MHKATLHAVYHIVRKADLTKRASSVTLSRRIDVGRPTIRFPFTATRKNADMDTQEIARLDAIVTERMDWGRLPDDVCLILKEIPEKARTQQAIMHRLQQLLGAFTPHDEAQKKIAEGINEVLLSQQEVLRGITKWANALERAEPISSRPGNDND
jgi:hypothetical protein